jgi:hypothetical protein
MENKTDKRIPIQTAKNIGESFGYTHVIITAFDNETGITSVTTWGKSQVDCEQAAVGGNFIKKALGWPPEKCNDKPARQIRKEKKQNSSPA